MYIETSRPRKEGDQARLVSPFFNVAPKNPYSISNPPAYCFGFFYHMYGKHIGESRHTAASRGSFRSREAAAPVITASESRFSVHPPTSGETSLVSVHNIQTECENAQNF